MSTTSDADGPTPDLPVTDHASTSDIARAGWCLLIFSILIFYLLVTTWPVLIEDPTWSGSPKHYTFKPFRFLGMGPYDWSPDLRMFLTVIAAGAVGSFVHTLTSFGDYVGNRRLSASWIWWFFLRTPIGIALAIVIYFVLRGGLLAAVQSSGTQVEMQQATVQLNPYGVAAFAALAGMFSRQATDKLCEVFETVFASKKPVARSEPLNGTPGIASIQPPKLTAGKVETLVVTGSGFQKDIAATINNVKRDVKWISDTRVEVKPEATDVASAGKLELILQNPNAQTFKATVDVT